MDIVPEEELETLKIRQLCHEDDGQKHTSSVHDTSTDDGIADVSSVDRIRQSAASMFRFKDDASPGLRMKQAIEHSRGAAVSQDSDVDSGIVAFGKSEERISSTSSTDTDNSQEPRRTSEYSLAIQKFDASPNQLIAPLHVTKRIACPLSLVGPVKADHSILKECNRRPPTPLTVFPQASTSVHCEEQLQLSEHTIRRSCRKLFATLYAHRFSYPSSAVAIQQTLPERRLSVISGYESGASRPRSQTLPDSELRKRSSIRSFSNGRLRGEGFLDGTAGKENIGNRKAVSWSFKHQGQKDYRQIVPSTKVSKRLSDYSFGKMNDLHPASKPVIEMDKPAFKTSTDSGLGGCRVQCTCPGTPRNSAGSSQSSSTSSKRHCSCSSCTESPASVSSGTLVKSNSCSTLPTMLTTAGRGIRSQSIDNGPPCDTIILPPPMPLQRTFSSSKIQGDNELTIPTQNDSMIHVYAEVANVVPDTTECNCNIGPNRTTVHTDDYHIYDTVKTSAVVPLYSTPPQTQEYVPRGYELYQTPKSIATSYKCVDGGLGSTALMHQSNQSDTKSLTSSSDTYATVETRLVPYRRQHSREKGNAVNVATVRPTTIGTVRPVSNGYLKPALKQSSRSSSHQSDSRSIGDNVSYDGSTRLIAEVEYAVVDKSKKTNRFTSLPALNGLGNTLSQPGDEADQPPVPPKKNLHKSDFALYRSRSSSPRKSLLEKVQGMTKSAKEALQRAFSTERIYRPEKEERLEATGQKLHRSKSFMKVLRASVRKRKKVKPPMAEVVPQSSSSPGWDEQPFGPNSLVHVRGQLLQLNLDGSQVIELSKPTNKPYGFFVARGRVRNSKGVFVSRMRDHETKKQLAGLLDIGDEILEIEGVNVKDADIVQVNNLMANKNTLLLTVLPYICRKDI